MSQRPRLASDGLLRLPETVTHGPEGLLSGRLSERIVDPFDWTSERLLLAESFARLELAQRELLGDWAAAHGIVDAFEFVGPPTAIPDDDRLLGRGDGFADHESDIAAEQANIAWHLRTLARLSEQRETRDWDPAWGQLLVQAPSEGDLVIGGPHAGARPMARSSVEGLRRISAGDARLARALDDSDAILATTEGWAVVSVGEQAWWAAWEGPDAITDEDLPALPAEKAKLVGTTWDLTVSLERLLIAPYVASAVERHFTLALETQELEGETRRVLAPREERVWRSILAPIYLQLLEALRRITEGQPGAAICRECGRPFLVLDARRRFFCNDRERFRHAQRERRRRLRGEGEGEEEPEA